jgi:hypothetical protein
LASRLRQGRTGFADRFTHLRTGNPAADKPVLLAAVLADGTNLGLTAQWHAATTTTSPRGPRSSTRTTSIRWRRSGMMARPPRRMAGFSGPGGRAGGAINAKYGIPGFVFYTQVSGHYTPFYTQVIAATVSEAPYVLDGMLHHVNQTDLRIREHYTDTAGATDHITCSASATCSGSCSRRGLRT